MKKSLQSFIPLLLLVFSSCTFVIPTTVTKKSKTSTTKGGKEEQSVEPLGKSYYSEPVKVIVNNAYTAPKVFEKQIRDFVKDELGFTGNILVYVKPKYPNKAYRDFMDDECRVAKAKSVLEFTFTKFTTTVGLFSTSKTAIAVTYSAYDFQNAKPEGDVLGFGAGGFQAVKKLFIKAVPH